MGLQALIGLSFWVAYLLRFDFSIPTSELPSFWRGFVMVLLVKIIVFCFMGLHLERWWRYVGFSDLIRLCEANLLASIVFSATALALIGPAFPRSIYFLDLLVCVLVNASARFVVRLQYEASSELSSRRGEKGLLEPIS